MKSTEQTILQVERFINKIVQKFPAENEASLLTDIHVRVDQESGELRAFDDDENEITRCVVEQWIDNNDENFYDEVTELLRVKLKKHACVIDHLSIMKPYSFVLENEDKETIAELYVADDDTVIIGGDIMPGLDKDLDNFLKHLMKE
ncbi:MAG: hypothetical protein LKF48_03015 [Prevotella sp.]|jgi:hypothetical protein|nr:hypothetical protein [Prevotella sp.]MCH4182122.1 hypothetical protein [Prevotella sp.]MCH4212581.1 hypothetical protein [Prevotella sp.]MCH4242004.1 hypothetical protein [Prevotella sp.]